MEEINKKFNIEENIIKISLLSFNIKHWFILHFI